MTCVVALASFAWSSGARAQAETHGVEAPGSLETALEAYHAGRLDAALEGFEGALREPGNTPARLVQIHLHLGILRGTLGDTDRARHSFLVALSIDPSLATPTELNPTLGALFEEVHANAPPRGLEVTLEEPDVVVSDAATRLTLRVAGAPEGMVARFRVAATAAGAAPWTEDVEARPARTEVTLPAAAWRSARELQLSVDALDEHGGVLTSVSGRLRANTRLAPASALGEEAPADTEREDEDGGSVFESPWLWIVVGVLVAGGVTAGVLVATAEERWAVGPPEVR